jgi:hypothetical protein
MSSFNNVEVNLTGTSIIREGAFAELFAQAVQNIAGGSLIDIVINVGSGNVVIESSAFQQLSNLPNNIALNSASFNFSPDSVPTLGANFASGLPVRSLNLPAQTTLQANALQNLPVLQHLDISQITNPVPSNGLNLTRTTTAPLLISMPTATVPFASGAVVFPSTGTNGTTTLIFNGAVPSTMQLNEMFTVNTTTVTVPIQISLNYSTTSNVTNAQLTTLTTALNNPVVVPFTQVQEVIQGLTQPTNIQVGGVLSNVSQFAGELFDSIPIAPKVQNASALNQTVIATLSSGAIASNVLNIPVPSSIQKIVGPDQTDRNVVGLVSRMNIPVTNLTSTPFYIMDNYLDPSDASLPSVPLIAIFSRDNAGTAPGSFYPALVCNGSLTVSSNGSVVVSGKLSGPNAYCRGYNAVGSAAQMNDSVNLLQTLASIPIYDRSQLSNALPIGRFTFDATTFSVHFNPVILINNSNTNDVVLGCMQDYRPNGDMAVDFTNSANAANAAHNTFSSAVANVIAKNNALVALVNQIRGRALPTGVTVTPALPAAVVSISSQLTALSQSDFSMALKNWMDVQTQFVLYDAYLTAIQAYVQAAIVATGTTVGTSTEFVAANTAFTGFNASLVNPNGDLAAVRAQLTPVNGVAPLYTTAISNYVGRRLSIGRQAFKTCTTMRSTNHFEFLRNISNINDETFRFCTAMSAPINIPVNVVSIGVNAYNSCTGATNIDIQNAFALRTIGNGAFENCSNAMGNIAFSSAINQASSVESIGDRAFFGCTKLTGHIYFPPGFTSLGVSAFENCSNLNGTIVFPVNANFTAIPNNAFAGCSELTGISTNTGNATSLIYVSGYPLAGQPIPNGLNLPANITQIGENAFNGCAKFAGALNLQQQGSVIASIGNSAFQGCIAFTSLVLPSTPAYTLISANCFRGCTSIASLTLSSNILHVSDSAFRGCNKIANIPQLTNIISLGNDAFNGCSGIVGALVLGENLTLLGDRAFFDCPLLTSATFLGPRPQGLSQAALVFGLSAGANTPFYVNVFTENGWNGTDLTTSNAAVVIHKGFRALVNPGNKSLVQMSYIDFNTYVPSTTSREITLNNYQSFNVFDNSNGSDTVNNGPVAAPQSGHSWNDVLLPSTLIGKDLASALQNFNPSSNIQNLMTTLVTPKIDAVQTSSLDSSATVNAMLNVLDGRNFEVKASAPGTPITLNVMANTTNQSTSTPWYGVFTDTSVTPNVDRLYFASTTGTTPVLVNGAQNEVLCYFVTSASAQYANKIITVDSTGAITVSSNVTAIGYGAVDAPTTVLFTSNVPTTARTGKGYSIVKSAIVGVLDKMYIDTLFAPAGTYYIGLVSVGGSVQAAEASKYNGVVVNVAEDGSVRVLESQLNNHFIDIPSASVYADEAAFNAANPTGGYGFINAQQSGANTPFKLLHRANGVTTTAASYYHHVHLSSENSVNNRLILVLPNGGVSVASFGVSGSVRRLQNQINALTAQSIPIYSSNQDFQNFDYHLNGVMSVAQTQLTAHNQELNSKLTAFSERYVPLKNQIEPMALFANVAGARPDVVAFATAFNSLKTSSDALLLGANGIIAYNAALANYETALVNFRDVSLGGTTVIGLRQIQTSTLNDPTNGILRFRRDSAFNANALDTTVIANPETAGANGLVNNIDYATTQMDQFLRELLYRQYANPGTDFATTTVEAIKTSVLFAKSPSNDASNVMYNDLSIQQRVLFDHVVNAVNLWFNSATPGAVGVKGGNSTWGNTPTASAAGTGLYSVQGATADAIKAAVLNWGKDNIFAYFVNQGQNIYNQFVVNNQPNTIASLDNIRASMTDYETTRNQPTNNTVADANVAARRTYIRVAAVGITQTNVAIDTTSQAALTSADNGKLRFNNATIASATKLYISLSDGTPQLINLSGYFDEIRLSDNLAFRVRSVTTTAACHELDVILVLNSVSNGATVTSFTRYQTISEFTLARLDAVNNYVYGLYYQSTIFNGNITPTKSALTLATTDMTQRRNELLTVLENLNRGIHTVVQNANALNQSENLLMATFRNVTVPGTPADLDGANMLRRESELLNIALQSSPDILFPSYESEWFKNRVAAFWVAQASTTLPTIANRLAAYTTANTAYIAQRILLQNAAIDSFVANTLASQDFTLPVTTSKIAEQVQLIKSQIPVFLITTTKEDLAKLIAEKVSLYVLGRTIKIEGLSGNSLVTARNEYQTAKIAESATALNAQRVLYGRSAHSRYLAVIDFAIATAYYPGLAEAPALAASATNVFQTLMQRWNAASNNQKDAIFAQIQTLLTNMIYTTDATATYTTDSFPLTAAGEAVSWFGSTQNGSLNTIIQNAFTVANHALDYSANGIPLTTYNLPSGRTVTFNGAAITLTAENQITVLVNGTNRTFTLITAPAQLPTTPTPLTLTLFKSLLQTAVVAAPAPAPAPSNAASFTPFNVSTSVAVATAVSSTRFAVVSVGYSSLPASHPQPLADLGFNNITAVLQFSVAQDNGTALYKFTSGNNVWHYGRQQSPALMNSWSRASPNQNVVIFYPGVADSVPANLVSDNVNALCDNATHVMLIESNNNDASLYKYDVFGVNSGALIAVGTLSPLAFYSVGGALQKRAANPVGVGINLVGNLVIPTQCRTVGINAFSGSNQIRTLAFSQSTQNSLAIGSNAFEACTLLPEINLNGSVASIGPSAFLNCTGAASLVLPPATSNFSVVNHWAFLGCSNIANDVQLNNNLVQISVQSFAGCAKLRCTRLNENLPSTVQRIGTGAFVGCIGLTGGLNFNNVNQNGSYVSSVSVIGSAAFMGCRGLNGQLVLPVNDNYANVLPYTFASIGAPLYNLNANLMDNANAPNNASLFMRLNGSIDFTLNKVKTIERNAFFGCSGLASLNLSNAITAVAPQSFMYCSSILQNLLIPASIKSIGSEAFRGCSGLSGLSIVSTVVSQVATEAWLSMGNNCFQDCTSIAGSNSTTLLVIPNSVNSIGDSAFQGCTSIVSVNVGSGLTKANSFGNLVFSGCTRLERVTFAFSFISRDVAGQSVVRNATGVSPFNDSFAGCTALGVPAETPTGTIQIQSGATGWTPGRAAFFNRLTIVINNRNITFYLKEFDQLAKINVVDPSTEPLQLEAVPPTDAQATVHIKASDMRKVFLTSTDSFVNGETDVGQMFFVRPELLPRILNVANARVVQGGIESYNAPVYEQLVKDDVMRYYAMSLFNSADWVSLFANDTEMVENMVASSGLMPLVPDGNVENGRNLSNTGVLHNIMRELEKVGYINGTNSSLVSSPNYPATGVKWKGLPDTVLPEQGNIGRKLFGLINRNDPNRISTMVLNGSTPSELPFLPGDQFIFIFTLNENHVTLNTSQPPVTVKKRTYLIRMILTDDFNSGNATFAEHFNALYNPSPLNQNILPVGGAYAADYMYSNYNLYMAIKPSVADQTTDSVYRRVTQNTFEPIPVPQALLPFTGWYYSYSQNTQKLRLNFTPPDINDSNNKMLYNDLKYLSAYVYFPNNWSSVSSLPNVNSFPHWVLTFYNGADRQTIIFRASFLPTQGAETVNFLGQTVPFDFTNTHVQLLLPFDISAASDLIALLNGSDGTSTPDGVGTTNTIAGTFIRRQRSDKNLVRGLRRAANSTVGPFTYPPIARGYQCIPMSIPPTIPAGVAGAASQYHLESVHFEINMSNNDGFVPSIIVKSVEVVAKNYEAYYLAPLDPN